MKRGAFAFAIVLAALPLWAGAAGRPGEEMQPATGARYDGHIRESRYIRVRDGTRIAVDLYRPAIAGQPTRERLPVVWMHSPYNRRTFMGRPAVEAYPGYASELIKFGYVVAIADFRGVYASFGRNIGYNRGAWIGPARWDAYDITEWLARQPWSSGRVGMWGCSATGGSQLQAATTRPPSLKAIIPMSAEFDAYTAFVFGGVARRGPIAPPGQSGGQDTVALRDVDAVPVDGEGAQLLREAVASHQLNIESVGNLPFRDSRSPVAGEWWQTSSPSSYLGALRASGIGVMAVANWDEAGTRHGSFFTFANLPHGQAKLLVGPATHCDWKTVLKETGFDLVDEERRFFDYWLKGVDNGVMQHPVTFFTYNASRGEQWQRSQGWPLAHERRSRLLLSDGALTKSPRLKSDFRWAAQFIAPSEARSVQIDIPTPSLIFETAPLTADTQVTGHPVAHLWVKTKESDLDVTAVINDISPSGAAKTYQMLGRIRASHRGVGRPHFNYLGLPWHSFRETDAKPMNTGRPELVSFELLPMSYVFRAGHRIQLAISFSGVAGKQGHAELISSRRQPSLIELPIIQSK